MAEFLCKQLTDLKTICEQIKHINAVTLGHTGISTYDYLCLPEETDHTIAG